MVKLLYKN